MARRSKSWPSPCIQRSRPSSFALLVFCHPQHPPSLLLPQEEPQSYLGYVGFCEIKSHCANSLPLLRNKAACLRQPHCSPGSVCGGTTHDRKARIKKTKNKKKNPPSLSCLNANPLPASLSTRLPSLLCPPPLFLSEKLQTPILGFFCMQQRNVNVS